MIEKACRKKRGLFGLSAVEPRQQVNQICNRLSKKGIISRKEESCLSCGRHKITNAVLRGNEEQKARTTSKLKPQILQPIEAIDIEITRNQIVRMCKQLSEDAQTKNKFSTGISGTINFLKDEGIIPRLQANMMLTICGLRNVYVYDQVELGKNEMQVASSAWDIINDWWERTNTKSSTQ